MQIEMRAIETILPYDRNPRLNEGAVEAVAGSLREFGWRQPIVVDGDGVIVVGHTRWKAARSLGWTEAPVHVARDLTPEQARAYRLADNQTATIADWDMELLPQELLDLQSADFNLEVLGWSPEDLDELLAPPGTEEGLTDADEVPEPPAAALTRRGDLWVLGRHRLLCGSSTEPADVDRLMNGERAALCATDPPYLVDYTGKRPLNPQGKKVDKDWSAVYREIDIADADTFFRGLFENVLRVLAPHTAIYCWHAHTMQAKLHDLWVALGILPHQQVIWVKPAPLWGRLCWLMRHEPCLMGWVKGAKPDFHEMDSGENTTVWEVDWEGKARVVGNEHPTQKPVEIFARPMRKHTRAGDVCFEPFSGSGSQLIAAETLGRCCYAMELEPVFVDVAVRRWERYTGERARRYGPDGAELPGLEPERPLEDDDAAGLLEESPAGAGLEGEEDGGVDA